MDQAALLNQLQGQLPDFWSKKIDGLPTLLSAYSYVYGSALQKWQMIQNELSPFTTDAYFMDYYKVIDLKKTITPSDPSMNNDGNIYCLLPSGTFSIDTLSRDLTFLQNLTYAIIYDIKLKQTLLQISRTQLTSSDRYLYINQYLVDNNNMINTWGSLFKIQPNSNITKYSFTNTYHNVINSTSYQNYLNNLKAQICAFFRCAVLGGTIDSLESLFSIASNLPYVTQDGMVIAFDSNNTWIESNGVITQYTVPPKSKFMQPNTPISAYEAIGVCPINLYSYIMNPARFVQSLLQGNAQNLYTLLTLLTNENPTALNFDMPNLVFDPASGEITFDFGVQTSLQSGEMSSPSYGPVSSPVYDFSDWSSSTLSPTIYLLFKNLVICEINNSLDASWVESILEYFRPLHSKYFIPLYC